MSGSSIQEFDDIMVMAISPSDDGGTLKNERSERTVPLHPTLIAEGFLDFVKTTGSGPLFYRRSSGDPKKRHAAKGVSNHLATWIRKQGFTEERKAPNHAFRHWWKSAAAKAGVEESLANSVLGHATPGEALRYRHLVATIFAKAVYAIRIPFPTG